MQNRMNLFRLVVSCNSALWLALLPWMTQLSVCRSRLSSISCDEEEQSDEERNYNYDEKENRKLQHLTDQGCFAGQHETRLTRLLGEWFSHCKTASVRKRRVDGLACPSRISSGFMGGFKRIIQRCGEKCCPRNTVFLKRYSVK